MSFGKQIVLGTSAAALLSICAASADATNAVLISPGSLPLSGTQNFNFSFGYDFDVNTPITISGLGVFDNAQDGLKTDGTQPIIATIYSRTTSTAVSGLSLGFGGNTGSDGTLTQGYRIKTLTTPVVLPAGQYAMVTDFYSQSTPENFYNAGTGTNNTVVRDTGNGAISFVGTGRLINNVHNAYPTQLDNGESLHYDAGTFVFTPEPASTSLLAVACLGLLGRRKRAAI